MGPMMAHTKRPDGVSAETPLTRLDLRAARRPVLQPVLALEDEIKHQPGQDDGRDGGGEAGFLAETG